MYERIGVSLTCLGLLALSCWSIAAAFSDPMVHYVPTNCTVQTVTITNFTNTHDYRNCNSQKDSVGGIAFGLSSTNVTFKNNICCDASTRNYRLRATLQCEGRQIPLCGVHTHAICCKSGFDCIVGKYWEPYCKHMFALSPSDFGLYSELNATVPVLLHSGHGIAYRHEDFERSHYSPIATQIFAISGLLFLIVAIAAIHNVCIPQPQRDDSYAFFS